ncbi:SRPBCC family protein [soil metagenome]
MTTMTRHGSAIVTTPSDREILITRTFDASASAVFDAWTTPEHVRKWWGSEDAPIVECDIDLRVGGSWRYVVRGADGSEFAWHGTYREIDRTGRLVSTEVFEGFPDAESVNTATLTENDGTTTLCITVLHSSKENRDGHLNSGMEAGMQPVLDRLEDLVRT